MFSLMSTQPPERSACDILKPIYGVNIFLCNC